MTAREPWEADLPDDSISTRDLNPTQMTGMIVGMIVAGVIVIRAGECLCRYPFRGRRQPDVELGQLQQPTAQAGNVGPPPPYNGPHGPIIIVEVPVGILGRFMNLVRGTRCPAELPPPAYDSRPPNPSNAAHGPSHQHSHNQHTLPEPQGPPPAYNELETRNSKKDMESTELL